MKPFSFLAGAAIAASALISQPAAAQDIFTEVLGAIGIGAPEKEPIEYRERAPLVVPRGGELRQPQQPVSRDRNAAWPNDPDVAARRRAAAERGEPLPVGEAAEHQIMRPGQLRGGPRTATNSFQGQPLGARRDQDAQDLMLGPARQMRAIDAQREISLRNLNPGEEPERKNLSDPPGGYRKPTEIVRAVGDPVKEVDASNTRDFVTEQRRQQGR